VEMGNTQILKRLAERYGTDPSKGGIDLNDPFATSQISKMIKEKCN